MRIGFSALRQFCLIRVFLSAFCAGKQNEEAVAPVEKKART
jgi:hypothetical protein